MLPTIIVIIFRLLVPLTIIRWPLAGVLLSAVADAVDVILADLIATLTGEPLGFRFNYPAADKALDIYYLAIIAFISLRWTNGLARGVSIALFLYRLVGVILFEATQLRILLFIFPNLFENFVIYQLVAQKYFPKYATRSKKQLIIILVALLIPKLIQEYILHWAELQPWNWLKGVFGIF